jgi:putative phosphoserine phosphatase / 1-acylglycerol-3-phosphate O-acyltransferase
MPDEHARRDDRGIGSMLRGLSALLIGWSFTTVYCTALTLLSIATLRHWARVWVAPAAHLWAQVLLALCGIRVVYDNATTLQSRAARVVLINHPSTLDAIWAALVMPPASMPIGKREMIYYPGLNVAWWALRFGLIDRSNPEAAHSTLAALVDQVRSERLSILMAPEGTRSRDGSLQAFKKGAFHLAIQAGVPICPVVAVGAHVIWPRQRWLPVPGVVRIRFLPPFETREWRIEDLDAHIARVHAAMQLALHELERSAD